MQVAIIPPFRFKVEENKSNPKECIMYFIDNASKFPTYWSDLVHEQCDAGAIRSVEDIYNYTVQRFPEVTLEQVVGILINGHLSKELRGWYCGDINRFVFRLFSVFDNYRTLDRMIPDPPWPSFDGEIFEKWRGYFDSVAGAGWRN